MPRRGPSPLLRELIRADQRRRQPELQDALTACRLANKSLFWGFDAIEISGLSYEPSPAGRSAAIVPVFDDGALIDLAACRLADRRVATRRGIARALGEPSIEVAIDRRVALPLFADPLHWLTGNGAGAVILDWTQTGLLLDGIESVICASRSLAKRVHDTTRRMFHPPRIHFVQRSRNHVV
jgi:hypothetical protein